MGTDQDPFEPSNDDRFLDAVGCAMAAIGILIMAATIAAIVLSIGWLVYRAF